MNYLRLTPTDVEDLNRFTQSGTKNNYLKHGLDNAIKDNPHSGQPKKY